MKTEKVKVNGKEEDIVTEFDDGYMNDFMLFEESENITKKIPLDNIKEALEDTIINYYGDDFDE